MLPRVFLLNICIRMAKEAILWLGRMKAGLVFVSLIASFHSLVVRLAWVLRKQEISWVTKLHMQTIRYLEVEGFSFSSSCTWCVRVVNSTLLIPETNLHQKFSCLKNKQELFLWIKPRKFLVEMKAGATRCHVPVSWEIKLSAFTNYYSTSFDMLKMWN